MKLIQLGSNQAIIQFNNGKQVFFSYNTPVAAYTPEKGYLSSRKKYSVTTSKHVNLWLENCEYTLVDQSVIDSLVEEE